MTDSTNQRARMLAAAGAPHGTLVTAASQSAGRGRQGRSWVAPPGRALLCSLVIRVPPRLLSLAAGVAVADAISEMSPGADVRLKWPNDVLIGGLKVAGILVEGRPQEDWAVLGIGVNVAVEPADLPVELRGRAGGLGRSDRDVHPLLVGLLAALERRLSARDSEVLDAVRARDALRGAEVRWSGGVGRGAGIDDAGRLIVETDGGAVALDAGEVHLETGV